MCYLSSCNDTTEPITMKDSYRGLNFRTIVVDSCEYIYQNDWFTHKGNCKFCIKRKFN